MAKIKEDPSFTKPFTSNGDARTVHPGDKKAQSVREHARKNEGYKAVGSKSKQGGDGSERVRGKSDQSKCCKEHFRKNEGYSKVGSGDKKDARDATPPGEKKSGKNPFAK